MTEKYKQGTVIHGIASSAHLDSSGERIDIKGVDISSLPSDGTANWEHQNSDTKHTVGKILFAKKIFKKSDCSNDNERYFWDKCKMPYIYCIIELFDGVGHEAAKDLAAMVRYDKHVDKRKTKRLINFSIEGSRLGKEGSTITGCIARKIAITVRPCNKVCIAEEMPNPKDNLKTKKSVIDKILGKSEENVVEIYKGEFSPKLSFKLKPKKPSAKENFKPVTPATGEHKPGTGIKPKRTFTSVDAPDRPKVGDRISHKPKRAKTGHEIYNDPDTWKSEDKTKKKPNLPKKDKYMSNMRKALIAGSGMGAPSTKTGTSALSKEDVKDKIVQVCKSISNENWKTFTKSEQLITFLEQKLPNLNKKEILALAKTVAYLHNKKEEMKLEVLDV